MPKPQSPSEAFADWVNATRALLAWSPEMLASIRISMDGATCGFDAAARKVASEIHARRIELNNNQSNRK